jgi:outer membrane protein assembly factor BamB
VVAGDGGTVTGRDAETGAVAWSYQRDLALCTVGAGFPASDDGDGHALALYASRSGWCSELTALHPSSGKRADASNPDMRPGVQLLANGSYVTATGADYLEVWRSDLVRTLEYGDVPTPVQPGKQPRPDCTYGSTAVSGDGIGVIERCPDAATDRLTLLAPDGAKGADTPDVQFSVELPAANAVLVAIGGDREAVAVPGPPRLLVLDRAGLQITQVPLDVPATALNTAPAGAPATVTTDGSRFYWWAGGTTIALDAGTLTPVWTLPDTLGPPAAYGTGLLAPVRNGLADLDPARGTLLRTLPVPRADPTAAVRLATAGEVVLEQRGPEVVALRPAR